MPIMARENRNTFNPAPEGLHQAVCVDVIDRGMHTSPQWGKTQQKVELRWQLDTVDEETGKRFQVGQWYTLSLSEKATLRKHLEAWRSRKFTQEELEGFDLEKLIGVNCQLQVIHNLGTNGSTYANVQAVVPLGKGMTKIRPEEYVRWIDRAENKAEAETATVGAADDETPF